MSDQSSKDGVPSGTGRHSFVQLETHPLQGIVSVIKPSGKSQSIYMHRMVLNIENTSRKTVVDHIDHNGLNNQKSNLRFCSNLQNHHNLISRRGRSVYKGVYFESRTGRWFAQIRINHIGTTLGTFNSEKEAALAYDVAARREFGEFCYTNFDCSGSAMSLSQ